VQTVQTPEILIGPVALDAPSSVSLDRWPLHALASGWLDLCGFLSSSHSHLTRFPIFTSTTLFEAIP
jgi:hypothetical protein